MPISPYLTYLKSEATFDPEHLAAMSLAFKEACRELELTDASHHTRFIAIRIITLAKSGLRNADHLRDQVLREAGAPRHPPFH
jgi:hypothetical protein